MSWGMGLPLQLPRRLVTWVRCGGRLQQEQDKYLEEEEPPENAIRSPNPNANPNPNWKATLENLMQDDTGRELLPNEELRGDRWYISIVYISQ